MEYSNPISLDCPYCLTRCQFSQLNHTLSQKDEIHHISYNCTNCQGIITSRWIAAGMISINNFESNPKGYKVKFKDYHPIVGDWKSRIKLDVISDIDVREDFQEAINCYNNGYHRACMIMARRAIQQEMELKGKKGENLYKQIESTGISPKLKVLLQKVKNFGNYGAHPDFFLFDEEGKQIEDRAKFAKLSLEFLDRYFADEYEIDSLIENAPNSEQEIKEKNKDNK